MSEKPRLGDHEPSLQWGLQHSATRLSPCWKSSVVAAPLLFGAHEAAGEMALRESTGQVDCVAEMELLAEREERFSYDMLGNLGQIPETGGFDCDPCRQARTTEDAT
jgi:hypothetical protein